MTFTRIALATGVLVLTAFVVVVAIGVPGLRGPVVALVALVALIGVAWSIWNKRIHRAQLAAATQAK